MSILHQNITLTLGALGASTAILAATKVDAARLNRIKLRKLKRAWSAQGKTTNQGPVLLGFSVGLTAAQIAAALTADPQSREDDTEASSSSLKVWPDAVLSRAFTGMQATPDSVIGYDEAADFPSWTIPEGSSLDIWGFNLNTSTTLTTGTSVRCVMTLVDTWMRD